MKIVRLSFLAALGASALSNSQTADAQQACGTVVQCSQQAVEAAQAAQRSAQNAFPRGAILAFRLQECPNGWAPATDLAGRVIVGAGKGQGLTERRLGETGGEETHRLTVAEMPSHAHSAQGYGGTDRGNPGGRADVLFNAVTNSTGSAGGDQPHNTMPPFYVLTYCEKK